MTLDSTLTDYVFICITSTGSMQAKSISYNSADSINYLLHRLEKEKAVCLLYYRIFQNSFDALAHKLMLENLCDISLNCVISRKNPGWEDLREELQEELSILAYDESE